LIGFESLKAKQTSILHLQIDF